MSVTLRCNGCEASLRIPDDLAGKKVKCPRCASILVVPKEDTKQEEAFAAVETAEDHVTATPPVQKVPPIDQAPPAGRGLARRRRNDDDDDRPRVRKRGYEFEPCPGCGGEEAKRVLWTIWGGFFGPLLFTHVRCADCHTTYNGNTGRSNTLAIVLFVVVPLAVGVVLAILAALFSL